jgi:hypothetical protein
MPVLAAIGTYIAAGVGAVVSTVASIGVWVASEVAGMVTSIGSWIGSHVAPILEFTEDFVRGVVYDFEHLLAAIHFKEIMAVNSMAMMVSSDYREMMNKVYGALGEYSKALGYSAEFISLALRNTRNLILDVSSSLGHKYDLADANWLSSLSAFLNKAQYLGDTYAKHPERLFADLENDIERHYVDAKGGFMQGFIGTVDNVVNGLSAAATTISRIDTDLSNLIRDLPETIRRHIGPEIVGVLNTVNSYIRMDVLPALGNINTTLANYKTDIDGLKKDAKDLAGRILTPKQTITAVKDLPSTDLADIRDVLDTVEAERLRDVLTTMTELTTPALTEWGKMLEVEAPKKPAPAILRLEPEIARPPEPSFVPSRATPFPGDY